MKFQGNCDRPGQAIRAGLESPGGKSVVREREAGLTWAGLTADFLLC